MINLLPPAIKEQVEFAKRNAVVLKYLKLVVVLLVVLGASFGATSVYLSRRIASIDQSLAASQQTIASYKPLEKKAKALNDRVAAIKAIQANQPRFSLLLTDIAAFTLKGTAITSLALTGDDTKPVSISATADSYNSAVSLREALVGSPRISGADIQDITSVGDGTYKVNIVIGFKPGQAR